MRLISSLLPLLAAHLRDDAFGAELLAENANLERNIERWQMQSDSILQKLDHWQWRVGGKNESNQTTPTAATGNDSSNASDIQDIRMEDLKEFEHCKYVVMDLGADRGAHVRRAFEGARYPGSKFEKLLSAEIGSAAWRALPSSATGLCALGVEADAARKPRLDALEACYRKRGWTVKFLVPALVSATGHETVRCCARYGDNRSVHVNTWTAGGGGSLVPTVDPAEIVSRVFQAHNRTDRKVIVKMDVEGAEYEVLPKMDKESLLCDGRISIITNAWHEANHFGSYDTEKIVQERYSKQPSFFGRIGMKLLYNARQQAKRVFGPKLASFLLGVGPAGRKYAALGGFQEKCNHSPTQILDLDDESYQKDDHHAEGNVCPNLPP